MPLITVSTSMGSRGVDIAHRIAQDLELEFYDDGRLEEEALRMGIRSEELKGFAEKSPGLMERIWGHKPELYRDVMEEVIYEVARRGRGVILGHGSQVLLRDFHCALHVRIFAPEDARIQEVMRRFEIDRRAATKMVRKDDEEQEGFFRFSFHMDRNDPSLYDLTVNPVKLGEDAAARLIMEAAQSDEIKQCSKTAIESMERLSLLRKIQAELLRKDFSLTRVHVEVPEKGKAVLWGWADKEAQKAQLAKIVQGIPGVENVQSELVVMPSAPT